MKTFNKKYFLFFFALFLMGNNANAQWLYNTAMEIKENQNISRTNYPYVIDVDTKSLIEAKLMNENASDLRFSLACEDNTFLPYWIESGINTNHTLVWVKLASLPANASVPIFLNFGNSTATSASTKVGMFADSLIISADKSLTALDTLFKASYIEIKNADITLLAGHSGIVKFQGELIKINSSSTLVADGAGNKGGIIQGDGAGPGKGGGAKTELGGGGGGAGYGGMGGIGCGASLGEQGKPGEKYGTELGTDIGIGSGGGGGDQGAGGDGGGVFIFKAQEINNAGTISVKGTHAPESASGAGGGGGGGSGGGVLMFAKNIINTGTINIAGGNGSFAGNWPGGGGGGGRLKFAFLNNVENSGIVKSEGGKIGPPYDPTDPAAEIGMPGAVSLVKLEKSFNSENSSTLLKINPSKNPISDGESITITANGPYANFDFFHNGELMQSGLDSIFTSTNTVINGDRFIVKNYETGGNCILISKAFIPIVNIVNYAPDAKDDAVGVELNTLDYIINVFKNDLDPNSNIDSSSLVILEEPKNGTASLAGIGEFYYTPKDNYVGKDNFLYKICDKMGLCDSAYVYISVFDPAAGNAKPSANTDNAKTLVNVVDTIDVLENDLDPDGELVISTLKIKTLPSNGSAEILSGTSKIIYTPENNFSGNDQFQYEICDNGTPSLCASATVNIIVDLPSGIRTDVENNFQLFPNPSNQYLNIRMNSKLNPESIHIYNSFGAKVINLNAKSAQKDFKIFTGDLPSGIYLVEIVTLNNRFTKMFVRQ